MDEVDVMTRAGESVGKAVGTGLKAARQGVVRAGHAAEVKLAERGITLRRLQSLPVRRDGIEALTLMKSFRPDTLVTDLMMPNMDGWELIRRLHEHHRELPVIVVTGANDVQSAVSAMRDGDVAAVVRPTAPEKVVPVQGLEPRTTRI